MNNWFYLHRIEINSIETHLYSVVSNGLNYSSIDRFIVEDECNRNSCLNRNETELSSIWTHHAMCVGACMRVCERVFVDVWMVLACLLAYACVYRYNSITRCYAIVRYVYPNCINKYPNVRVCVRAYVWMRPLASLDVCVLCVHVYDIWQI